MIRGDLSNRLIHLTRGADPREAADRFQSILREGKLRGENGYIKGGFNCICFSEAPISILTQTLADQSVTGIRYAPFGVIVSKAWLFSQGGRPVIYQADNEYDLLPLPLRFRHVRYEPNLGIDYTWEREWRIHADSLLLHPTETTFVVPTRSWEEKFHQEHVDDVSMNTFLCDFPVTAPMPWHFVVLEDLGVEGFDEYAF